MKAEPEAVDSRQYVVVAEVAQKLHLRRQFKTNRGGCNEASFLGAPSPLYDELTARGTSRLLQMLQDFKVEQFIFSSTVLVHASSPPGIRITEDSSLQIPPKWPESKIKTERVIRTRRAGKSLWHTFWRDGDAFNDNKLTPQRSQRNQPHEMFWGVTVPWNLIIVAGLGIWLMAAPAIFQTQKPAADINYILSPLIWVIAIISLAEVVRAVRFVNIMLAIALMVLPWLLGSGIVAHGLNNLLVGTLVIVLSIPAGKIKNTFGSWNRLIV